MPDYHIAPEAIVEYPDWAMVGGWQALPATFTPSARVGLWATRYAVARAS